MPIWYPDRQDVEFVARHLAARYFPSAEDSPTRIFGVIAGAQGESTLESALGIVRQPHYRFVHSKAGALLRSLIKNHPFIDGNKRIAVITTIDFLVLNDHVPFATDDEWVALALEIAATEGSVPWQYVSRRIGSRCLTLSRGSAQRSLGRLASSEPDLVARAMEFLVRWTDALR